MIIRIENIINCFINFYFLIQKLMIQTQSKQGTPSIIVNYFLYIIEYFYNKYNVDCR